MQIYLLAAQATAAPEHRGHEQNEVLDADVVFELVQAKSTLSSSLLQLPSL